MSRDRVQELRMAVHAGDGVRLVGVLGEQVWLDALQLAGDAVIAAVAEGADGAAELARRWIAALQDRDWDGDAELAAELEVALGLRPAPAARPLRVDLEELSEMLDAAVGENGGRIDLQTGEVWRESTIEYFAEEHAADAPDFDDADRWLEVWPQGSEEAYRDMEAFIETTDATLADRLATAIEGRGAFRRFKDAIAGWPDERERWFRFTDERRRGRARQWLADAGYRVAAPAREK